MSFIGIDLGTTFIKGAVLDLETRELHHVRRTPFPPQLENTAPLSCEFDPGEILNAVRALLAELAPRLALVSVGPNTFGHPTAAMLALMKAHRVPLLRTDRNGDVTLTAGPHGLTVAAARPP